MVAVVDVLDIATAQGTSFPDDCGSVRVLNYNGTIGLGGRYDRVASQPTHPAKFRSQDRYLPDGTTSTTNGGWWGIKQPYLGPMNFGASAAGNTTVADVSALDLLMEYVVRRKSGSGGPEYTDRNSMFASQAGALIEPGIYDVSEATIDPEALDESGNNSLRLVARIPGTVIFRIEDDKYGFIVKRKLQNTIVDGIIFIGGKGAFRFTGTEGNVGGIQSFSRCAFVGYTECSIQNSAPDHPFLRVRDCIFYSAPTSAGSFTTIGVAWGGLLDGLVVEGCSFMRNDYHLKLGSGQSPSGNFYVLHSDFLHFGGRPTQADIWLVPRKSSTNDGTNSGWAATIERNKFGNENQAVGAPRILICPQDETMVTAGYPRGAILPDRTWVTTGHVLSGLVITGNRLSSISSPGAPFIQSFIPAIRAFSFTDNKYDGGQYEYGVHFEGDAGSHYLRQDWHIDLGSGNSSTSPFEYKFSNGYVGPVVDRHGIQRGDSFSVSDLHTVNSEAETTVFRASTDHSLWLTDQSTTTTTADPYGGSNAVEYTLLETAVPVIPPRTDGVAYIGIPGIVGTEPRLAWVQLDLARATARSIDRVLVELFDASANLVLSRREVRLTDNFQSCVFPVLTPISGTSIRVRVRMVGTGFGTGSADRFRVFGICVNSGRAPVPLQHLRTPGSGGWNNPHIVLGPYHLWVDGAGRLRIKSGAPASDGDGSIVGTQT